MSVAAPAQAAEAKKSDAQKSWESRRKKWGPTGRKPAVASKAPRNPGTTRETAPRATSPAVEPRLVYEVIGSAIVLASTGANFGAPRLFGPEAWTVDDHLTGTEIGQLTAALGEEALGNRALAAWLTKIGRVNKHGRLGMVLLMIAAPRLARRGMLPAGVMEAMSELGSLEVVAADAPVSDGISPDDAGPTGGGTGPGFDFDTPPVSVATGGAPHDNGGYGLGEVEAREVSERVSPMVHDVPDQGRRRPLRREAHENGGGPRESQVSAPRVVSQ